jgi:hypothetical protein
MVNKKLKAMKIKAKYALMVMALITMSFISCEKFSGDTDSISGAWRCFEESQLGYKNYSVTIFRAGVGYDTTYFIINNFNNLGLENETLVQLNDSVITIKSMDAFNISGTGYVRKNFKEIVWEYSVSGTYFNARYTRQ